MEGNDSKCVLDLHALLYGKQAYAQRKVKWLNSRIPYPADEIAKWNERWLAAEAQMDALEAGCPTLFEP